MEIPVGAFAVERTTDAAAEETGANLENRGFAGGCNRGISHVLRYGADFVWLYLRPTLDACRIETREGAPNGDWQRNRAVWAAITQERTSS